MVEYSRVFARIYRTGTVSACFLPRDFTWEADPGGKSASGPLDLLPRIRTVLFESHFETNKQKETRKRFSIGQRRATLTHLAQVLVEICTPGVWRIPRRSEYSDNSVGGNEGKSFRSDISDYQIEAPHEMKGRRGETETDTEKERERAEERYREKGR